MEMRIRGHRMPLILVPDATELSAISCSPFAAQDDRRQTGSPLRQDRHSRLDNKAICNASIPGISLGKLHGHFMLRLAGDGAAQSNALVVHNGLNL